MPLPFARNDGKRQFACFVCGIILKEWADFKKHIYENHEEGKDFVKCPLERCRAPVRDVRAHYRVCHQHETIPNNCQMRSLIWRDAKDPNKKKKKVAFKEGYFLSVKNGGRKMHYNSGWELEVYEVLEQMDSVIAYEVEPLEIDYWFKGEKKTYLPDLRVHFDDGRVEVWEIKPANQCVSDINKTKWDYCNEFCQNRGWKFIVITEVGIGKMKNDIRKSS